MFRNDIRAWIKRGITGSILLLLFLFLFLPEAMAQNRKELEDRRKKLIKEIEQTQSLLQKTQKDKEATLDRFFALQNQIKKRQQLIGNLREEIDYTNQGIDRAHEVIDALQDDVDRLKKEYSTMLRAAYRHKINQSWLAFLFSANSLNDVFQRWQYIKQYDRYRKRQAELIVETQNMLVTKAEQLEERRLEKEELLTSIEKQRSLLDRELVDKNKMLRTLKSDESRLVVELQRQEKAREKLNLTIEEVIRKEMARKRREARTPEALAASAEADARRGGLTNGFTGNKGLLPWPVQNGEITRHFGNQPHPTIKTIQIANNGIDIKTDQRAEVFAVFEGEVAGTQFIPGYKNTVILQHGQYYTVYSNLDEIYVRRGDQVKARQSIGRLDNQKPEVHFEIWREKQRLNPVQWVTTGN